MVTEATETNSEDTGDSEGAVSKAYARFKPVTGVYTHSAAARQDGEAETSGNGAERGRVFYGHDGYYVFFRLHQCLYERCVAASAWHTLLQQQQCCNNDHHRLHWLTLQLYQCLHDTCFCADASAAYILMQLCHP